MMLPKSRFSFDGLLKTFHCHSVSSEGEVRGGDWGWKTSSEGLLDVYKMRKELNLSGRYEVFPSPIVDGAKEQDLSTWLKHVIEWWFHCMKRGFGCTSGMNLPLWGHKHILTKDFCWNLHHPSERVRFKTWIKLFFGGISHYFRLETAIITDDVFTLLRTYILTIIAFFFKCAWVQQKN